MKAKENHLDSGMFSPRPNNPDKSKNLRRLNPDIYLRHPEQHRGFIIERLFYARMRERPAFNKDFICLVKLWRLVASKPAPGQLPCADLEFLRWLLQGRVKEAIAYLRRQSDINVWYALKTIERTVFIDIPEKQAIDNQVAMENWLWLKRELLGGFRK